MLTIPFLILYLACPAVFWLHGRRIFGESTHPAALFILSYIACIVLLSFSGFNMPQPGAVTLLLVVFSFAVVSLIKRLNRGSRPNAAEKTDGPDVLT